MRKFLIPLMLVLALLPVQAVAQSTAADENMKILIEKIKADKKLLIAANMELTDAEAKGFWPVYDAYQRDLQGINGNVAKLILDYADAYNKGPIPDDRATALIGEFVKVERSQAEMFEKYAAQLKGVLPASKVARYLQIENKIRAAIRYEVAAGVPLAY
jgi:hypothetical protein